MIREFEHRSLLWGIPGIILQIAGGLVFSMQVSRLWSVLGICTGVVGLGLFVVGLTYYCRARGRHAAYSLLYFGKLFNFLDLLFLKDKTEHTGKPEHEADKGVHTNSESRESTSSRNE